MKKLITIVVAAELFVALAQQASAGSVSVSPSASMPATINLTAEGTLDWAHWGLSGSSGQSETWAFNHKDGADLISDLTIIEIDGKAEVRAYSDMGSSLSWSDGTPTALEAGTHYYLNTDWRDADVGDGFSFTVPAVAANRTLRVYVGSYLAQGTLTATLSGGSSHFENWVNTTGGNLFGYFEVNFSGAGETLTVTWELKSGGEPNNIKLAGATLSGEAAAARGTMICVH